MRPAHASRCRQESSRRRRASAPDRPSESAAWPGESSPRGDRDRARPGGLRARAKPHAFGAARVLLDALTPALARLLDALAPTLARFLDALTPALARLVDALAPPLTRFVEVLAPPVARFVEVLATPISVACPDCLLLGLRDRHGVVVGLYDHARVVVIHSRVTEMRSRDRAVDPHAAVDSLDRAVVPLVGLFVFAIWRGQARFTFRAAGERRTRDADAK